MRPDQIHHWRQRRPFQPFRVRLSNGSTYEIRHPELLMVGRSSVLIGIAAHDLPQPTYEQFAMMSLVHIAQIEPIALPDREPSPS